MATQVPQLQQAEAAGLEALGLQDQQLEQQKLNQLALAAIVAYQLPTDRLTDIANIYGSMQEQCLDHQHRNLHQTQ